MSQIAILVRHGESEANAKGIISEDFDKFPLTAKGKNQAKKTGEKMSEFSNIIDGVYSSPVLRARETAESFIEGMGLKKPVEVLDGLRETYFGKYNNVHISKFPAYHKEEYGIEPFKNNGKRILKTIGEREGVNIYFSHMLPIKAAICDLLDIEEEDAGSLFINNASMTVMEPEKGIVHSLGSYDFSDKLRNILLSAHT